MLIEDANGGQLVSVDTCIALGIKKIRVWLDCISDN